MTELRTELGEVEIRLGPDETDKVVLRPNIITARAIARLHGGYGISVQRVSVYDLNALIDVIRAALPPKLAEDDALPDKIWGHIQENTGPVIRFLNNLANGGRPLTPPKDEKGGTESS